MSSKGINETLSLLIGIILMIFIFVPLGIFLYNVSQQHPDVRAPIFYDQFIEYYQACIHQEETDCYCEELDFSLLPPTEFIQIQQLADKKISIELWKVNGEKPLRTTEIAGKQLCTAYFSFGDLLGTKTFETKLVPDHIISVDAHYTPSSSYFLTLYHAADSACFINQATGTIFGGEPPVFHYKRINSLFPSPYNTDELIYKYLVSCKDKKASRQPSQPQPSPDLFPSP